MRGPLLALSLDSRTGQVVIAGSDGRPNSQSATHLSMAAPDAAELVARRDAASGTPARWVWWSTDVVAVLLSHGVRPRRGFDLVQAHALLHGGAPQTAPERVWACARGLDPAHTPQRLGNDLFDALHGPESTGQPGVLDDQGYLSSHFLAAEGTAPHWARLALQVAAAQYEQLARRERCTMTAHSESGAAVLALELQADGLPLHRPTIERLIGASAGPRPHGPAEDVAARRARDALVLHHVPPGRNIDLRNPEQVRTLLTDLGIRIDSTRKQELEQHRHTHPIIDALLRWRVDERIASTYGWHWLDQHLGADDRLRGRWSSFDGGAGRMSASAGLHNLPATLRPAVLAEPGRVFVRSDLGQIEPRVLAVISADPALTAATRQDDLYQTVAEQLRVERPVAKLAVLSAMYGGSAGRATAALEGLNRAYPVAMDYLLAAQRAGEDGEPVMTYGGRYIAMAPAAADEAQIRARGRFARNAVVQGAAAEFFKAWALTVQSAVRGLDARIVMCLHDELLLDVPAERADDVANAVEESLQDSARRWSGHSGVRFVTDTAVISCWADAKG